MSEPSTTRSSPLVPGTRSSSSSSWTCSKIAPTFISGMKHSSRGPSAGEHAIEVGGRLVRGALPGERLGEGARLRAEARHEVDVAGDARHRRGHRWCIAVRNEVACLTVTNRLVNAGRVRRDHWGAARGCLEIRDVLSLLRRGEDEGPRPPQQAQLLVLADAPKKPHALAEVKRRGELLERGAVVARTGDLEARGRVLHRGERLDDVLHALVPLQPTEVREDRLGRALGGAW